MKSASKKKEQKERKDYDQVIVSMPSELKQKIKADATMMSMSMSVFFKWLYINWRGKERKSMME